MNIDQGRVLVIDDDANVRASIVAYLEDSGFDVIEASDGEQGLVQFLHKQPDLIICDLRMPKMDGMKVLRRVVEADPDIPIIVVSGAGVMSDVVEALRLGAIDYFIKPLEDMALMELSVRRAIEQSNLRHQNKQYRHELERANKDLTSHVQVLEKDQQAGRYVQLKMLPETPKTIESFEFSHHVVPSLYLSGDFVEYVTVGDEHITFFIADVSGHGASSAFVTVLLKNLAARLRSSYLHRGDTTLLYPSKLLAKANTEMLSLEIGKHVTLFVGTIHIPSDTLTYANAAHLPLPILSDGKNAKYLSGHGKPIGLFPNVEFEEYQVTLPESFSITLFSDGVLEVMSQDNIQEKEQSLLDLHQSGPISLNDTIERLALNKIEDAPDDIAVMTIQRK